MSNLRVYCGERIPVIDEETGEPTGEFVQPDGSPIVEGEVELSEWDLADIAAREAAAQIITRAQVDAERDRRTEWGFTFNGKSFRLDEAKSVGRITAMGADARFAIAGGAQANDYFWADPENPFGFIATDNSVMPMDAQTMRDFANAAKLWVSRHTFAGLTLKSMTPIPADFADDSYWPAE